MSNTIKARLQRSADDRDAIWTPAPATPAPVAVPASLPDGFEAEIVALIHAPRAEGETAHDGHRRKEQAIGAWFDVLTTVQARALHARLVRPRGEDALATAFGRFARERQERLLAFLADTARRQAMRAARAASPLHLTATPWAAAG
jgi:hypothetical protein